MRFVTGYGLQGNICTMRGAAQHHHHAYSFQSGCDHPQLQYPTAHPARFLRDHRCWSVCMQVKCCTLRNCFNGIAATIVFLAFECILGVLLPTSVISSIAVFFKTGSSRFCLAGAEEFSKRSSVQHPVWPSSLRASVVHTVKESLALPASLVR